MKYIIEDWAGNVLSHKGFFGPSYLVTPMQFVSFEDGWSWIYENIKDEDEFENVFVLEK